MGQGSFVSPQLLSLHEFCKHLVRIDGNERAAAARQNVAVFVQDLRHVDVLASAHAHFARLHPQGLV